MSRTFCIDIGGTRIKAAILKDDITLDELKLVQPKVVRTLGWLNESLPDIVPFLDDGSTYDRVYISIPDDVLANGREIIGYLPGAYKVPRNFAERCEDITGCPVALVNDAVAWTKGIGNYFRLQGRLDDIVYPSASIIFGTGVGFAYSSGETDTNVTSNPISACSYGNLSKAAGKEIKEAYEIHGIIGETFFDWVRSDHRDWDLLRISEEYTKRVVAFLKDVQPSLGKLETLFIGGGNVRYVISHQVKDALGIEVHSLIQEELKLNPDLIPLVGLIKANT